MSKVSNFISKEFNTILKETREYRAYELGVASGYYNLYNYIKLDSGEEFAKKFFKSFLEGTDKVNEYFRKLIELSEEPLTDMEKKIYGWQEKMDKCKATE